MNLLRYLHCLKIYLFVDIDNYDSKKNESS